MECYEILTDAGRGRWGDCDAEFALSTITRAWRTRSGDDFRSLDTFRLTFRLTHLSPDFREFDTESQRAAFLTTHIQDRCPLASLSFRLLGCRPPLVELVGDSLAGVWFVQDYVQFQFQDEMATFYEWPVMSRDDSLVRFGEPGYRDALCSLIGQQVSAVDVYLDAGVVVSFSEAELVLSSETIRLGGHPEIVESRTSGVWSGMPPFD